MASRSASTYLEHAVEGDLAAVASRAAGVAAERLNGEATLVCAVTTGHPGKLTLCTTWSREWDEPDPATEPAATA
jgi:hypothetical protein